MSVHRNENKEMLFDLLRSIGQDNNLRINDNRLYQFINERCNYFHVNRINLGFGNNLELMNKKIVEDGYNFIMSNQEEVIKKNRIQMTNREVFEQNLANQESNFKKMINPNKPKEIDFSDNKEDLPIQNLDIIMNQTLADRQRELESITQKYSNQDQKKAQQWLNREEETPKIKIENNSNLSLDSSTIEIKDKKRVTFNLDDNKKDNKNNFTNFLSKLKQKPSISNNDIMDKLNTIISNQNEIIKLLNKETTNQ